MIRVIEFKTVVKPDGKQTDWVHYSSLDAMSETGQLVQSTWEAVETLRPPAKQDARKSFKYDAMRAVWGVIEPKYITWRETQEIPEDGTPLAAWSGVSPEQVKALQSVHIRTVEDLANLSEDRVAKAPLPRIRDLVAQAKAYISGADQSAMAARLVELEKQNAAMLEMLAEQKQEQAEKAEDKPKRGRPRKVDA